MFNQCDFRLDFLVEASDQGSGNEINLIIPKIIVAQIVSNKIIYEIVFVVVVENQLEKILWVAFRRFNVPTTLFMSANEMQIIIFEAFSI